MRLRRAGRLRRTEFSSRDPHVLLGKVLRITPTGEVPLDNPYALTGQRCALTGATAYGGICAEAWAGGLRNPYKLAIDPNHAGRIFINDVGETRQEEINESVQGADYGWNLREGVCDVNGLCGSPTPSGLTDPLYAYPHSSGCSAITGGAFVPAGAWSDVYDHAYLYADFVCGRIFSLRRESDAQWHSTVFADGLGASEPVGMTFATTMDGDALYYTRFFAGDVRRIRYVGQANRPPTVEGTCSPLAGAVPLTISCSASGSDPDGDSVTFSWDFGDGSAAAGAEVEHTYAADDDFMVTLRATDLYGDQSEPEQIRIAAGNLPPELTLDVPSTFAVGETLSLKASATDDDVIDPEAIHWTVRRRHHDHFHPYAAAKGESLVITGPDPEGLDAVASSRLEVSAAVTDSRGVVDEAAAVIRPRVVRVTLLSEPTGAELTIQGETRTAPQEVDSWEGWPLDVAAAAVHEGFAFSGWSDGGQRQRKVTTPHDHVVLIAKYWALAVTPATLNDGGGGPTAGAEVPVPRVALRPALRLLTTSLKSLRQRGRLIARVSSVHSTRSLRLVLVNRNGWIVARSVPFSGVGRTRNISLRVTGRGPRPGPHHLVLMSRHGSGSRVLLSAPARIRR